MFKDKFRTLCYLESQLEAFHRLEQGSFEVRSVALCVVHFKFKVLGGCG